MGASVLYIFLKTFHLIIDKLWGKSYTKILVKIESLYGFPYFKY